MSNMSYCRFQNTSGDLEDCKEALDELLNEGIGKLSQEESHAAKRLVQACLDIVFLLAEVRAIDIDVGMEQLEDSYASIIDEANEEAEE